MLVVEPSFGIGEGGEEEATVWALLLRRRLLQLLDCVSLQIDFRVRLVDISEPGVQTKFWLGCAPNLKQGLKCNPKKL